MFCGFGFSQRVADGLAEVRRGKKPRVIIIPLCVKNPVMSASCVYNLIKSVTWSSQQI